MSEKKYAETKKEIELVEKALFNRAKGYSVEEKVPIKVKKTYFEAITRKEYTDEEVEVVTITKHIPADIQAVKFFLMNKAKEVWQDNPHKVENDKENLTLKKKQMEKSDW